VAIPRPGFFQSFSYVVSALDPFSSLLFQVGQHFKKLFWRADHVVLRRIDFSFVVEEKPPDSSDLHFSHSHGVSPFFLLLIFVGPPFWRLALDSSWLFLVFALVKFILAGLPFLFCTLS